MISEPATLQQALQRAGDLAPGKHVTYVRGQGPECSISYADLHADASALGGWLTTRGIGHGEPIVLASSTNEGFVRAFWTCVFAGAVPVPLAIPASWNKANAVLDRFRNVSRLLRSPRVMTPLPTTRRSASSRRAAPANPRASC